MSVTNFSVLQEFLDKHTGKLSRLKTDYRRRCSELSHSDEMYIDVEKKLLLNFLNYDMSYNEHENICDDSNIREVNKCFFSNGVFHWENSLVSEGITLLPLEEAVELFSDFFCLRETRWENKEKSIFALLNGASYQEGVFFFFPKFLKEPLRLSLTNIVNCSKTLMMPRIHVILGEGVHLELTIEHDIRAGCEDVYFNGLLDVFLGKDSSLVISKSNRNNAFNEVWSVRATLSKNALLKTYFLNHEKGSSRIFYDCHVLLEGEGADTDIQGGFFLENTVGVDLKILTEHLVPKTSSRQTLKVITNDTARSNFKGGIYIASEAEETDAYQKFSGLMLSEKSMIRISPQLEILADNVTASHGVSVKQLEKDLLFYLMTRGFKKTIAEQFLTNSFFNELVLNFKS